MLDYALVMPTKIAFGTIAVIFTVYSNEYILILEVGILHLKTYYLWHNGIQPCNSTPPSFLRQNDF